MCIQRENYNNNTSRSIVCRYVVRERRAGLVVCAVIRLPSTPGKQWVRIKKYTSPTNRYVFQRCGSYPAAISREYICL